MALTESREMETQMRRKVGGLNRTQSGFSRHDWPKRPSPTEDAIAQKRGLGDNLLPPVWVLTMLASTPAAVPSVVRPRSLGNYEPLARRGLTEPHHLQGIYVYDADPP